MDIQVIDMLSGEPTEIITVRSDSDTYWGSGDRYPSGIGLRVINAGRDLEREGQLLDQYDGLEITFKILAGRHIEVDFNQDADAVPREHIAALVRAITRGVMP